MISIIFKNGTDDYTVWYPEIPANEPLLKELLAKYENDGGSTRGTKADIIDDLKMNL